MKTSAGSSNLFVAEPSPTYLGQRPLVVDSSVICAVVFDEPSRAEAMKQLSGRALHAPYLLDHEVASVAAKKLRAGWPAESIAAAVHSYVQYGMRMHRTDLVVQLEIAEHYALSAYDAAYLCVAASLRAPLATFDKKLAGAASRHLGGSR